MVSDPVRKGWWGYGLVFDRIYRINRIEGRGEERGRRGNHAESAEGRGNSDGGKATLTLRQYHCITSGTCCVLSLCALCSLWQKLWKLEKIYLCIKDFTTQTHNQTTCAMPTPISSKLPPMSLALNLQNVRAHIIIQRQQ